LTGTLSSQIGEFKNLSNLSLDGNEFDGTLPPELMTLTNLVAL
jgi:hypothetical protein